MSVLKINLKDAITTGSQLLDGIDSDQNEFIDDICLTGSTATAKSIQKNLASHPGPIKQIIAETRI